MADRVSAHQQSDGPSKGRTDVASFLRVGARCLAALVVAAALGAGLGGLLAQTRGPGRVPRLENPWARQQEASPTAFITPGRGLR